MLLKAAKKKKRLQWTHHENWSIEDGKKVSWTEESKFEPPYGHV